MIVTWALDDKRMHSDCNFFFKGGCLDSTLPSVVKVPWYHLKYSTAHLINFEAMFRFLKQDVFCGLHPGPTREGYRKYIVPGAGRYWGSNVARPNFWEEPNILTSREQQYFVWNTASQRKERQDTVKILWYGPWLYLSEMSGCEIVQSMSNPDPKKLNPIQSWSAKFLKIISPIQFWFAHVKSCIFILPHEAKTLLELFCLQLNMIG